MIERNIPITRFFGIRNQAQPELQPFGALESAVNVDLDDAGMPRRRDGYALAHALSGATDAWSPTEQEGLYVLAGGSLRSLADDLSETVVATGLTDTRLHWVEFGDRVFYAGATDAGCVLRRNEWLPFRVPVPASLTLDAVGGSLPAGDYQAGAVYRHTTSGIAGGVTVASATLAAAGGFNLSAPALAGYTTEFFLTRADGQTLYYVGEHASTLAAYTEAQTSITLDPAQKDGAALPTGVGALAAYENRLFAAVYDAVTDITAVYSSGVFYPACWAMHRDYLAVPGEVLGMIGTASGLVIGSENRIYAFTEDYGLRTLAHFGVVPGRPFARDKAGNAVLWTQRGVCTFPEFQAPQHDTVAVAPGTDCTVGVIERRGRRQFLAVTDGAGDAWNAY